MNNVLNIKNKISERTQNYILYQTFPQIIHGYFSSLSNLISFANSTYNYMMLPEKIYTDRVGQVCTQWITNEVLLMFRNQRVGSSAKEMTIEDFIKYAEGINNVDFVAAHGREMNYEERAEATAAKRAVRHL